MKKKTNLLGVASGPAKLGKVVRGLPLLPTRVMPAEGERSEGSDELVELEFAFASEEPVEQWFGRETLDISAGALRLGRVTQGVCPVVDNHSRRDVVGRVLSVNIGADRIARARVRFSRSDAAKSVVQDVVDGIRQGVSCGYRVHKMELIETGDDGDAFRVTDWELLEVTIATVPADETVGVHRSADGESFETIVSRKATTMKLVRALHTPSGEIVEIDESKVDGETYVRAAAPQVTPPTPAPPAAPAAPVVEVREDRTPPSRDQVLAEERARVADIEGAGRDFDVAAETVRTSISKGHTVEQFLGLVRLERAKSGEPLSKPPTDLDLSRGDRESYSILNATRVAMDRRAGRRSESSLELEASDTISERLDRNARGFFVPYDVLSRSAWNGRPMEGERAATSFSGGQGSALVADDLMAGGFIDLLRNRSVLGRLGATIIPGLVGNIDFPKQLTDVATGWVAEGAGSGDSTVIFGTVSMTPKTVRSRVDVTRRMLLQSTPAVEQILRNSLGTGLSKAIDIAGLAGSGVGAIPEGVLNMSGVGAGAYSAASPLAEFQSLIGLETLVAVANADEGSLGYVTTPEFRGRLKGRPRDAGSGSMIWTGSKGAGEVNGYQAEVTNSLPKNLTASNHPIIAGYWPWLYIGEWGVLDLMPDEITLGDSAGLVLRAFQDVDVAAAHEAAFAVLEFDPAT